MRERTRKQRITQTTQERAIDYIDPRNPYIKRTQETTRKQGNEKLLSPKSGTATSSPMNRTPSHPNKSSDIPNVLWYMKKNGYADTTIKATGKRLRHLQRNCNLQDPEDVKGYIANKESSNAFKETLIEAYARALHYVRLRLSCEALSEFRKP